MNIRKNIAAGLLAFGLATSGCSLLPTAPAADTPIETVAVATQTIRGLVVELRTANRLGRLSVDQVERLQARLEYAYGLLVLAEEAAALGNQTGSEEYLAIVSAVLLSVEKELANG